MSASQTEFAHSMMMSPLPFSPASSEATQIQQYLVLHKNEPFPLTIPLPKEQWQSFAHDGKHCKIERMENRLCRVTSSVNIYSDMSWDVFFHDRLRCLQRIYSYHVFRITSSNAAIKLLPVDSTFPCIGNPDEKFVSMCNMRGDEVRGDKGHGDVVAYIDKTSVTDVSGKVFSFSVCRKDCELLISKPGRCTCILQHIQVILEKDFISPSEGRYI